jgi:hypothetical protein
MILDDEDNFLSASTEIICTHYRSLDTSKHGGSIPVHRVVCRKREVDHWKLFKYYFSDDPMYGAEFF